MTCSSRVCPLTSSAPLVRHLTERTILFFKITIGDPGSLGDFRTYLLVVLLWLQVLVLDWSHTIY